MRISGGYVRTLLHAFIQQSLLFLAMTYWIQLIIFNLAGYEVDELEEPNAVSYPTPRDSQYGYTSLTGSAPTPVPPGTANADNFRSSQVFRTLTAIPESGYEPYVAGNTRSDLLSTDFGTIGRPDVAGYKILAPAAHDGSLYTHLPVNLDRSTFSHSRRSGNSVPAIVELTR
jgi:hypothetical protein